MPQAIPYIALIASVASAVYAASLDLSTDTKDTGTLINKSGTRATRDVVYGRCLTGATPLWSNVSNNNSSKLIQVFSCGVAVSNIHQVLIDEVEVLTTAGNYRETTDINSLWFNPQTPIGDDGAVPPNPIYAPSAGTLKNGFQSQCEIMLRTGWPTSAPEHQNLPIGTPMNLPILLGDGEWTGAMRGDYTAMMAISSRRVVDSESIRIMSPSYQVNLEVSGVPVYDPRNGSDPLVKSYSRNPALAALDYITNSYYGMSIKIDKLDLSTFILAANHCDTNELYIDGQLNQGESFATNLDNICKCAQLSLFIENGKLVCKFESESLTSFAFNADNILNGTLKVTEQTSGAYTNVCSVNYKNSELEDKEDVYTIPANIYPTALLPGGAPNPDYPTQAQIDGYIASTELDMPLTRYAGSDSNGNSPMRRFANIELLKQQFQKEIEFDIDKEDFNVSVFDVISVSEDGIGWVDKLFRITGYKTKINDEEMNIITILAKEYDKTIYRGVEGGTPPSDRPTPTPTVTPPTNLAIDTSQPAHAVFTWTPTWFETNTTYEIAIKKTGDPDFVRVGTTGSERWDFEILDADAYDFAIRTLSQTKGTSNWTQLVAANPVVAAPTNVRVDFSQSSYAVVYWDTTETDKETYHEVSYKLVGESEWINPVSTYETSYTIETQLGPAQYRVRTVHKQYGYSSWTGLSPVQPVVTPPTNVRVDFSQSSYAVVYWDTTETDKETYHEVSYNLVGESEWINPVSTYETSYTIETQLGPAQYRVRTVHKQYGYSSWTGLSPVQPVVTPPTSLAFVQHDTGSKSGGTLSWVGTWDESNVKYQVEFKPSASSTWTQLSTVEAQSYDFPVLPPNTYDFRVATKSTLYALSAFTELTDQVVQAIGTVSPVTGVFGTTTTSDHRFGWDSALENSITLPANPNPLSPSDPKVKDYFSHYQVDIFNSSDTLKGQYQAAENNYVFTFAQNKATVGGADRTIRIDVYIVLKDGTKSQIGLTSTATVKNEQIVSTNDTAIITPSLESFTMKWSQREELDYEATLVHVSTDIGFVPSTSTRKADSNSNTFYYLVPEADRGKTHYVRFSHRDTFGYTDLTYTAEQSVVPQNIDELLPNFPEELSDLRDPDKAYNNTGELTISVTSPNKKHVSGVGLYAKDSGDTRFIIAADEFVVSTGGHADWLDTTNYVTDDRVSWNVSDTEQRLYIAKRNNINKPPLTNPNDWRLAVANTYQSAFYVDATDERLLIRNATIDDLTATNIRANALTGDTLDFNTIRGDQITSETTIIAGINRKQADVWQMGVGASGSWVGYNSTTPFGTLNNTIFRNVNITSFQSNSSANNTILQLDSTPSTTSNIYIQVNNGGIYEFVWSPSFNYFVNNTVDIIDSTMVGNDITIWISDNDNRTNAIAGLNGSDIGDTSKPNNVGVRIFAGAETGVVDVTKPVGDPDRYAPFMVNANGKMYARDANIKGTIEATSGIFTGDVTVGTAPNHFTTIRGSSTSDTQGTIIVGHDGTPSYFGWKFKIDPNGSVHARTANDVINGTETMTLDPLNNKFVFNGTVYVDKLIGDIISKRSYTYAGEKNSPTGTGTEDIQVSTVKILGRTPYDRMIDIPCGSVSLSAAGTDVTYDWWQVLKVTIGSNVNEYIIGSGRETILSGDRFLINGSLNNYVVPAHTQFDETEMYYETFCRYRHITGVLGSARSITTTFDVELWKNSGSLD